MSIYRLIATLTLGLSGTLLAQPPTTPTSVTRQFSFPPVGVALTETIQVNLFNQAANAANGTAASCTGTVSFLDAKGNAIAKSGGPFTVAAGDTQSINLLGTAANTATTTGSRAEIRAVVSLTLAHGTPCSLVESLETFDSGTGATHVFVTGNSMGALPIAAAIGRD